MKTLSAATERLLKPLKVFQYDHLSVDINDKATHFVIHITAEASWGSISPSHAARSEFVQRIPERRGLAGLDKWEFAATDITAAIIATWPPEQVTFTPEARLVFDYFIATLAASVECARRIADFKENNVMPPGELELHPDHPLALYQQVATLNAMSSEGYALFMEQGTGKTPVVITRICNEAGRMRAGTLDNVGLQRTEASVRANLQVELEALKAEAAERVQAAVQRKRSKLEAAARAAAAKRQVSLDYTGTADMLLVKAREAVRAAELWLTARMAEVEHELAELRAAMTELSQREMEAKARVLTATAEAEIRAAAAKCNGETRAYRALIICPNNVRLNWLREFEKFATRCGNVTVLRGGEVERARLLIDVLTPDSDCEYTVAIVSYDSAIRMQGALQAVMWDLIVLDESHYVKWQGTKRWQFVRELRKCSRRRMVLTGTPVCNTPLDLFTQLEFLGYGWSGFHAWEAWRRFYGVFDSQGAGYEKFVGCQNMPFMQERLARLAFMIRKSEALPNLPEKVYDVIEVEMTPEQTELYNKVRQNLIVEIENALATSTESNRAITITNVLTKLLRLAQITSGFVTYDAQVSEEGEVLQPKEIERLDPNPKLDALVELMKEKGPNDKTIVWACWVQDIRSIAARLRMEGIDCVTYYGGTSESEREEAERRFNCGPTCKVLIGNPTAGGVGLNLLGYPPNNGHDCETNCNHVIYYSQGWSATARSQSEDRAHRRGTRTNVRVTDLCVPDTIDEEIRARVVAKRAMAYAVSDVREILRSVLRGEF